ncbi:hypothetical protein GPECTOR_7g1255 [Gonium pectorale]|uniref:Uncharacterized protein n=1 Tax=Gonium pectorale TaxID=33097 RepID=A0A150GU43_GONPE|nr:hypothetical protein GPECTOR_7g1255 [Gonium pectorale]|eukprot:KXZ53359.1 hypothetical protein GPECTOR_7g1255 [Gonium pectorale]
MSVLKCSSLEAKIAFAAAQKSAKTLLKAFKVERALQRAEEGGDDVPAGRLQELIKIHREDLLSFDTLTDHLHGLQLQKREIEEQTEVMVSDVMAMAAHGGGGQGAEPAVPVVAAAPAAAAGPAAMATAVLATPAALAAPAVPAATVGAFKDLRLQDISARMS